MVYTNDLVWVENSIHTMELLLADYEYKLVGFDLEFTAGHARFYQKVVITQLCVHHQVLVYHYYVTTMPCVRFDRFVNSSYFIFGMVDTTNDEKVLKTMGLACRNLVDIQGEYRVLGGKKKQKDSLFDLAMAIIDPNHKGMKDVFKNKKVA
ncbi:hypothetical protein D1007_62396 [Hordeum vulgare]|nr:hypothetical protein D1007_62396 [Hordeum vulgare]